MPQTARIHLAEGDEQTVIPANLRRIASRLADAEPVFVADAPPRFHVGPKPLEFTNGIYRRRGRLYILDDQPGFGRLLEEACVEAAFHWYVQHMKDPNYESDERALIWFFKQVDKALCPDITPFVRTN